MMENLLFAEHSRQVHDLLNRGVEGKSVWVALGPSAMAALNELKTPYSIPEDFYSPEELEEVCLHLQKRTREFCDSIDGLLLERHPHLAKYEIRPFLLSIMPLSMLFGGTVKRIFELKSILKAYPEEKVRIHKKESTGRGIYDIAFSADETLYGNILALRGWENPVEFISEDKVESPESVGFREKLKNFASSSFYLTSLYSALKKKSWKEAIAVFPRGKKGTILMCGGEEEWKFVIPELRRMGWRVLYGRGKGLMDVRYEDSDMDLTEDNPQMGECFEFDGIDFYPLLKMRLGWILGGIPQLRDKIIPAIVESIRTHDIKAVMTSGIGTFAEHAFNLIAIGEGTPVLNWQHGFVGYNKNITQLYEYSELVSSSYNLVYGEDVKDAFDKSNKYSFPSKSVPVGSASIDCLKEGLRTGGQKSGITKVLYATTSYYMNFWYYGFTPPYSDRLMFDTQVKIVNFLEGAKEKYRLEATVKLHPSLFSFDEKYLEQSSLKFVRRKQSFIELLKLHDLIILDMPTTALLQAISTRKPVFALMRHLRYSDYELGMLGKRAVCSDDLDALLEEIDAFLRSGHYDADLNDETFLRKYGTYLNDGKSAERAADLVNEVATGRT
jgi:hypothetical protein